jgi:hypothetical protein
MPFPSQGYRQELRGRMKIPQYAVINAYEPVSYLLLAESSLLQYKST